MERVTRIELALAAWEAAVLPLNYTRDQHLRADVGASIPKLSSVPATEPPDHRHRSRVVVGRGGAWSGSVTVVLLSDRDIRAQIDQGRVVLDPYDPEMVQSVRVVWGPAAGVWAACCELGAQFVSAQDQPELTRLVEVESGEGFVLHPGEFVLGSTLEAVTLPDDLAARVEGKSSLGRLGLLTHATAGFVDPGFSGHVTLELSNVATLPIVLWPGMKVGQLCFMRLTSASEHPYGSAVYGSHYQGQRGPTASRSFHNFHRSDLT